MTLPLSVLAFAMLALLPAGAAAERDPTPAEVSAITAAGVETAGSPTQRVKVTNIEVSDSGRWAVADVSLYLNGELEMAAQDMFYRRGAAWLDTANANTPERTIPADVERELGLAESSFGGIYFEIYLFACWFFGLAALFDVALQPSAAFARAGRSKTKWFALVLVFFVVLGVFVWAYYAARIRPAVVRAGGRPPRKLLRDALDYMFTSRRKKQPIDDLPPVDKPPRAYEPPPGPEIKNCDPCSGSGRQQCISCGGAGYEGGDSRRPCYPCGTTGRMECVNCRGSGRVSVMYGVQTPTSRGH
jgi:hypothetical protein